METLTRIDHAKTGKTLSMQRVTLTYIGTGRPGYMPECRYKMIVQKCLGSVYCHATGEWIKDRRVMVYKPDAEQSGYIMFPSSEAMEKEFVL